MGENSLTIHLMMSNPLISVRYEWLRWALVAWWGLEGRGNGKIGRRKSLVKKHGIARNRTWVLSDRCEPKPQREVLTTILQSPWLKMNVVEGPHGSRAVGTEHQQHTHIPFALRHYNTIFMIAGRQRIVLD